MNATQDQQLRHPAPGGGQSELTQPRPSMRRTIYFQEIPIGGHFEFRGRRYQKLALSLARDEERNGNIFMAQTEVMPDPFAHLGPIREAGGFGR